MAKVEIRRGLDPAGLTESVLQDYLAHREQSGGTTTLWLTPTRRSKQALLEQLLARSARAVFAHGVKTFDEFSEWLVTRADRPASRLSPMVRRLLLRRITRELESSRAFQHFRGVASTAGFLDVVASFIAELKSDEIWPEDFLKVIRKSGRTAERDRELGVVYQRYQDILLQRSWYDNEGRTWFARTLLLEGHCRELPPWSLIVVNGFSDFTRPQYEMLSELSERTERLILTLTDDPADGRTELFEACRATGKGLAMRFPQRAEMSLKQTKSDEPPFCRPIREHLFGNPRHVPAAKSADGLEVIAATGQESEWRAVALRIKALLGAGARPGEIVVGVRSLSEEGGIWSRVLRAAGLPVWTEAEPPLRQEGLVKFLIMSLQAEAEDWEYHRLTAVLSSSFFQPTQLGSVTEVTTRGRAVSSLLRSLRIPGGRAAVLEITARVAESEPSSSRRDEEALDQTIDETRARAILARPVLSFYHTITTSLRRKHTLRQWIDVLAEFVIATGAARDPADAVLWDYLQRLLRDAADAEADWTSSPVVLDQNEFLAEFRDLLANETRDPPPESRGSVRVLSMDQIRHVDTPHLFLVGLTEESFPRRRADDCLFSDAERERLAEAGLPLQHAARHQQEEAYYFWSLLVRARQTLTLSYAAVNARGQPSFASPYVIALQRLFAPGVLPVHKEGQLDPIPSQNEVLTGTDRRLVAMEAARSGRSGWLRSLGESPETRPMTANLLAAIDMAAARFSTPGFTAYEGRLSEVTNQRRLRERFGPNRQFSATEFESYASCPFRFWLSVVMDIEPLPTLEEGTDHLRRGVVVHDVLAEMRTTMAGIPAEELTERFGRLVSQRLQRQVSETELQQALTRLEERLLNDWGGAYARQFTQYQELVQQRWESGWQIAEPEIPFGDVPRRPSEDKLKIAPPLEFSDGSETVLVRGRIDRVDVASIQGRTVYNVIDYKTGKPPRFSTEDVRSGRAVQLVLYALAVKRLGLVANDALPFQLGYWAVRETGFKTGMSQRGFSPLDTAVWESLEAMLSTILPRLASGIRSGEFVVDSAHLDCTGHCAYRTVCRVNQVRPIAEKLRKSRSLQIQPDPTPAKEERS
ncbi:MAG TPA: PD-(D/E)XK nuclease family protein [Planctomycetaceae bacterium]|jgi:ATP-dependent helicase/DNAse subunit B|nr:PD-(D/E)XK nuclease family protein [Planctomycetaceae bacterium]